MSFSTYLKSAIWDFILVACLAVAMTYQVLNCFYVSEALQYGPIPGIVAVVESALLIALAFNKRTTRMGGIAYAVVALMVIGVSIGVTGVTIFVDYESNYLIFSMVLICTPTAVFLLSRTRTGSAFLFIICAFMVAAIQFFYPRYELHWVLIAIFSSMALIIYKNYQLSARTATSVRSLSFIPGFVVAIAGVAVAVGLGLGIWYGIIAPLNPDAVEIKLVTEYRALETQQHIGTSSEYQIPNLDYSSSDTNDQSRTTDQLVEQDDGIDTPANGSNNSVTQEAEESGTFMGIDQDSVTQFFQSITFEVIALTLLIALAVVIALVITYFVDRRVFRNQRLTRYAKDGANQEIINIYLFLVDKLALLGLGIPAGLTTMEYAQSVSETMARFDAAAEVKFSELAGLYTAVVYGKRDVSDEDLDVFVKYYKSFWKSARKYLGNFKYFFKSFKLG